MSDQENSRRESENGAIFMPSVLQTQARIAVPCTAAISIAGVAASQLAHRWFALHLHDPGPVVACPRWRGRSLKAPGVFKVVGWGAEDSPSQ